MAQVTLRDIRKAFGATEVLHGISLDIASGAFVSLLGASGCGKTTLLRIVAGLESVSAGSVTIDGRDVTAVPPERRDIAMMFQSYALLPHLSVFENVRFPLRMRRIGTREQQRDKVAAALDTVQLGQLADRRPRQLSGGQKQRVGIARAFAGNPTTVVADEPVSALDVSIQAQVVNLLSDLQKELGVAFLFIAHDLAVVRHFCPEVAVMYLGKIVEVADRETLYDRPRHPYTQALLSAVPDVRQAAAGGRRDRIRLQGDVPSPLDPPSGCRFRTRCWMAREICATQEPPLLQLGEGHKVACHFADETAGTTTGRVAEDAGGTATG